VATFTSGPVTVTFTSDSDAFSEKREARVAVQEIPGGDTFYVDRAGRRPLNWSVGMLLANATVYGQLNSRIAETGTLTIETLDTHAVVLMSVGRPSPQADGQTRCSAEFLVTDA
jgi:hypothetical protein